MLARQPGTAKVHVWLAWLFEAGSPGLSIGPARVHSAWMMWDRRAKKSPPPRCWHGREANHYAPSVTAPRPRAFSDGAPRYDKQLVSGLGRQSALTIRAAFAAPKGLMKTRFSAKYQA